MSRKDDDFLGAIGLLMTGFGLGVAIGTIMGLLFAPKSGKELRRELAYSGEEYFDRAKGMMHDVSRNIQSGIDNSVDRISDIYQTGTEAVKTGVSQVRTAVDTGVKVARERIAKVAETIQKEDDEDKD